MGKISTQFLENQTSGGSWVASGDYEFRFGNPNITYSAGHVVIGSGSYEYFGGVGYSVPDHLPQTASLTVDIPEYSSPGTIRSNGLWVGGPLFENEPKPTAGVLILEGEGSQWINDWGDVIVGADGNEGELVLRQGAHFHTHTNWSSVYVGGGGASRPPQETGQGHLLVTDADTMLWAETIYINNADATIKNGAYVISDVDFDIGSDPNCHGSMIVTGSMTSINSERVSVGVCGTGVLRVEDSATVFSVRGSIASETGAVGEVTVQGAGSEWEVAWGLDIGDDWYFINETGGTGTLTVSDGGVVKAGQRLTVHELGTLDLANGKMLVGEGDLPDKLGTVLVSAGGTLSGTGQILGDIVVDGGTLSPGRSPGTLHIQGDLELTSESELIIEVAGSPGSGLFDVLEVDGDVHLDGKVTIDFTDYTPLAGMTYNFLSTSGSLFGELSQVEVLGLPSANVLFDPSTGQITAVPEPSGLVLLLSVGICAMTFRAWRYREH